MLDNPKRLIAALVSIILLSVMNGTMFNVAVPAIGEYYRLSPADVSWVITAYAMFFAIGAVTYGKLADIYSIRLLISVGLSLFALGSAVGFIAPNYAMVIVGRIIQASGGAAIPALAMIVATKYFPPGERGKVLGYIASTVAFGSGIGPIVGGAVAQFFSWRYLFLFSIIGILAIPFLRLYLPKEEAREGSFDTKGAAFFGLFIAFLLLFLNKFYFPYLVLGLVFFILFFRQNTSIEYPFINFLLFKTRSYSFLLAVGFLAFAGMMSTFFVVPMMLKEVNGLQVGSIGLVLFPGAMTAGVFGSFAGRLVDKYGSPKVLKGAIFLMFTGFLILSTIAGLQPWIIALGLIVPYVGFASVQSSLANYVSMVLPRKETGIGMGLYNLTTFISTAISTAFVSFFLETGQRVSWNPFSNVEQAQFTNVFIVLAGLLMISYFLLAYVVRVFTEEQETDCLVEE